MGKALYRMNQITTNILDRKGEEILQRLLPPKRELILHLRLAAAQEQLVQAYLQVRPAGMACAILAGMLIIILSSCRASAWPSATTALRHAYLHAHICSFVSGL